MNAECVANAVEETVERPPLPLELRALLVRSVASILVKDYLERHSHPATRDGIPVGNQPKADR